MGQALAYKMMSPENPRTPSQGCTTELTVTWSNGLAPCGTQPERVTPFHSVWCILQRRIWSGLRVTIHDIGLQLFRKFPARQFQTSSPSRLAFFMSYSLYYLNEKILIFVLLLILLFLLFTFSSLHPRKISINLT